MAMRAAVFAFAAQFASAARVAKSKVATYEGFKVLRAVPTSQEQVDLLREGHFGEAGIDVDMWREPFAIGDAAVMMFSGDNVDKAKSYLSQSHIEFTTTIEDVQELINEEKASLPRAAGVYEARSFNTYGAMCNRVTQLASEFSGVASEFSMGKSSDGRNVPGLKINIGGGSKPAAMVLCGIHSREWINPASCMYVVDELLAGTAGNAMNKYEWHIVPIAQPDGYVFSHTDNRMWRKNRVHTGGNWFKTYGVDINRNYAGTRCINSQERSKSSDSYCGPSAWSEVETRNIRDYMQALQGTTEIRLFLDVHAFSQMWLWPYGHTSSRPSDEAEMARCGNKAADASEAVYGSTWKRGPIATTIYAAGGSSVDWTYDALGIVYSYALELRDTGKYGFMAPVSEIEPSGRELLASFQALAACAA